MTTAHGWAAQNATDPLAPFTFQRRPVGPKDVQIAIKYCGVCHSDLHQVRNEWGGSAYPMVPGHEIIGIVEAVGSEVKKVAKGDVAAVGCLVDSCRNCGNCKQSLEQFCSGGASFTYNGTEQDRVTVTQGGYSDVIVTNEDFVLKVSPSLSMAAAAPLLCAGITTYSPLRHWGVKAGDKVAVVGLGGLGHMGVKFAKAFGAHVTVITTSPNKKEAALKLGADDVVISTDKAAMEAKTGAFSFILDTVSATHDLNALLNCLQTNGTLCLVGVAEQPLPSVEPFKIIFGRRSLAGSLIGGLKETQEMLDFCAKHNIVSDIELINIQDIEAAYARMRKSDVKYRFVIDMASITKK